MHAVQMMMRVWHSAVYLSAIGLSLFVISSELFSLSYAGTGDASSSSSSGALSDDGDACYTFGSSTGPAGWVADTNYYRAKHSADAVEWDEDLARKAKAWAEQLETDGVLRHSNSYVTWPPSGENLARYVVERGKISLAASEDNYTEPDYICGEYTGPYNQACAVYSWWEKYNASWNCVGRWQDAEFSEIGQFTALVWKGVDIIGCGSAGSFYVCEYGSKVCKAPQGQLGDTWNKDSSGSYDDWVGLDCSGTTPPGLPNLNMDSAQCVENVCFGCESNHSQPCIIADNTADDNAVPAPPLVGSPPIYINTFPDASQTQIIPVIDAGITDMPTAMPSTSERSAGCLDLGVIDSDTCASWCFGQAIMSTSYSTSSFDGITTATCTCSDPVFCKDDDSLSPLPMSDGNTLPPKKPPPRPARDKAASPTSSPYSQPQPRVQAAPPSSSSGSSQISQLYQDLVVAPLNIIWNTIRGRGSSSAPSQRTSAPTVSPTSSPTALPPLPNLLSMFNRRVFSIFNDLISRIGQIIFG